MLKKILFVGILIIIISTIVFGYKIISRFKVEQYYGAKVDAIVNGNILKLSNGKEIQLAGAYIPVPEDTNYRQELRDNFHNLLTYRIIKYKIIEKKRRDYPKYDLAIVYMDGSTDPINEILLRGKYFVCCYPMLK